MTSKRKRQRDRYKKRFSRSSAWFHSFYQADIVKNVIDIHSEFLVSPFELSSKDEKIVEAYQKDPTMYEFLKEFMMDIWYGVRPGVGTTSASGFPSDSDHEDV